MPQSYNVYCDESCHLEHDHQGVMVLGAVWCPAEKTREVMTRLKEIKARHGVAALTEVKWVKASRPKLEGCISNSSTISSMTMTCTSAR
jgi:hypothetical protein